MVVRCYSIKIDAGSNPPIGKIFETMEVVGPWFWKPWKNHGGGYIVFSTMEGGGPWFEKFEKSHIALTFENPPIILFIYYSIFLMVNQLILLF